MGSMSLCRASLPVIVLLVLATTGCEEKKPARTAPPAAAQAPTIAEAPAPPQPEKPPEPKPDPVAKLLAQAENEYAAGQANYKAGHLEAAKANFDRAVDLLMQGPVDINSDERVRATFDKIVDEIHKLEIAAFQQGDGFAEQRAEPAPIDEASEMTFPADPETTAKAVQELRETRSDIPLVINEYVAGYINFFTNTTKGRNTVISAWKRGGRYKDMIIRIMAEEGVPQDLFHLAQAESGFKPTAVSRAAARGMWQFMHYTAPIYGLKRNWWVDERQDPEKATRAAARHLKDLYNQFGDWWLAMAAYNSGAGNVQRGVQRTGYADFWELYKRNVLPNETKNYVPIIIAMTIVAKNAAQYGFTDIDTEPPLEADVVTTDYALDLRLVAEAIDVPVETLAELNPALLRMMTPRDTEYELKLPAGAKEKFESAIGAIPRDKRVAWRYHKVIAGDTLAAIARKYRTTTRAIAEANNLEDEDISAGGKLIIPMSSNQSTSIAAGAYSRKPTRYKVRKGDTVLSIADDFGVPADKLRKWNRIKGSSLRAGRTLVIYKPLAPGTSEPKSPSKSAKAKRPTKTSSGSSQLAKRSGKNN
jgi:membrane-bound lytic murein transglycosylase D